LGRITGYGDHGKPPLHPLPLASSGQALEKEGSVGKVVLQLSMTK